MRISPTAQASRTYCTCLNASAVDRPETGQSARGDAGGHRYPDEVAALTDDQLELLQRAIDGLPMWGGSVATDRLRREVELLIAIGFIKRYYEYSYTLTDVGACVLMSNG